MKKWVFIIIMLLLSGTLLFAQKKSLSTKFTDIILSGLKPGMVYSLKKEKNVTYKVLNESDEAEDVEVVVEIPNSWQMKPGYEPIPDVSWVKLNPTDYHLKPGESTDSDIILVIPDDEKYANRHFQAMLVTQSIPKPQKVSGVAISFAIAHRIRFSTGPRPETVMEEHRKRVLEALKLELSPLSLFLPELSVGEKVILDGDDFSTVQIVNRARENYKIEFQLAREPRSYGLTGDYVPIPEEIEVKFKKKKMRSKKRSISEIIIELKIPDKEEFYGKSFAFVVIGQIKGLDFPVELFSRVYFKTADKSEKLKGKSKNGK